MRRTNRFGIAVIVALAVLAVSVPRGAEAQGTAILIGNATGPAGGSANVAVGLMAGTAIAGTENEIGFPAQARIAFDSAGEPDCQVNPAIGKQGYFAFQPTGCTPGSNCTGIKAIVIGIFESTQEECDANPEECYNLDPIPDGSTLYTCRLTLGAASGTFPLTCANPDASDPDGVPVDTTCSDGQVTIEPPVGGCCGDQDNNGSVSSPEATRAVLAFGRRDLSQNPSADCNGDGSVSSSEATRVVLNFGRRECNP